MRFIYPAIISKEKDGRYKAVFPDLAMCEAEGDSLDDVIRNANAAAYDWIDLEMHEEDPDIPAASHEEDLTLSEGQIVRSILVIYRILEGWDE
jgi:predicted RNase H-like HicB family nuclease